jgi:nucleotide-binding universal stress UspA family protein
MAAVKYVCKILSSRHVSVVLFHIMRKFNEAFIDMGINPAYRKLAAEALAGDIEEKNAIKKTMDKSHRLLLDAAALNESIETEIRWKNLGVSRDIINEAGKGYDAVVVGRRGLSRIKDLFLGSVPEKLVQRLRHTPVWVVGEKSGIEKVLLAFDSSGGARKAVSHAGEFLGANVHVTLLYAMMGMRSLNFGDPYYIPDEEVKGIDNNLLKKVQLDMRDDFEEAKRELVNSGLSPEKISAKLVSSASSRAGAILDEAKNGGYGTIILGRRGLSKAAVFFMGRVSRKVLHMAKEPAVWIVP